MSRAWKEVIFVAGVTAFVMVFFLLWANSYFHHQEIRTASEECVEAGGTPEVDKGILALTYSFSCLEETDIGPEDELND